MPMAEVAAQASGLWEIAGAVTAGAIPVAAAVTAGFVRLGAKFEAHSKHNALAHERMEEALEKLNGTGRENAEAIVGIEARCEERHK